MKKEVILAAMLFVSLAICLLSSCAPARDQGAVIKYRYANSVTCLFSTTQYWLQDVTSPASAVTMASKTDIVGNYVELPLSAVTTSSGCCFDFESGQSGRQFRLIFTSDPTDVVPSIYKLAASNPGQFAYNVFCIGTAGDQVSLMVTIPYPFVTKGSQPIRVYSSVSLPFPGCLIPAGDPVPFEVSGSDLITTSSGTKGIALSSYEGLSAVTLTISGTVPNSDLFYAMIHLDFGLKDTIGYANSDNDAVDREDTSKILISDAGSYAFSVAGVVFDTQVIHNRNVFRRDIGFAV